MFVDCIAIHSALNDGLKKLLWLRQHVGHVTVTCWSHDSHFQPLLTFFSQETGQLLHGSKLRYIFIEMFTQYACQGQD